MARGKRKTEIQDAFDTIAGFRDLVDDTFERLTGKSVAAWLKEFQQPPRELPRADQPAHQEDPGMSLARAYMVLGLPQTASFEEVKRHYRNLAVLFHPDKGGNQEAMVLLNQAYQRIQEGRSGSH